MSLGMQGANDTTIREWFVYCVDSVETLQWENECRDPLPASLIDIILEQWGRMTPGDPHSEDGPQEFTWPEWKDNDLLDVVLDFFSDWTVAKEAALAHGWNGSTIDTPQVFHLWRPSPQPPLYGFVLEQDFATTFIVSPQEFPDLRPLRAVASE